MLCKVTHRTCTHMYSKSDHSYIAWHCYLMTSNLPLLQWSFGVTCWEVFSAGKIPYGGVDPLTMIQLLESGKRLNKPSNTACSEEM